MWKEEEEVMEGYGGVLLLVPLHASGTNIE
jgi:hypothetical protein